MKHNLLKSVVIAVSLFLGVSNIWAVDHTGGYIYFLKPSTWTEDKVMMFIGHDTYTSVYEMSKVTNTDNLYRYTMPSWGGANYVAFANAGSVWGSDSWGSSNRTNAPHYTNVYKNYGFNSGSYYVIVPSGTGNNASITINYTGTTASSVNLTTKAIASNKAHGTVSVSGYYLSSATAVSTRSAISSTASDATASTTLAPASTITFKATANSGYDFIGWYDAESGGNQLSTSTTYTVKYDISFAGKTVYARFKEPTYTVTISAGANGTVSPNGSQQVGSTSVTIKATANTGYKFKNWTKTGGVTIANANDATTTITATATGTVKANFEEDLTSTWHIVGDPTSIFKGTSTWAAHNDNMLKKTTGASAASKGSLTVDVAALPASESSYQFKVLNTNGPKWYGWSNSENYWVNRTNNTTNVYNADNNNLYFIPDALGEYKFDVDWSSSNPSLKVTFPTAYAVTFGKGTGGSSVTAKYNSTSFNSGTKVQQGKTVTFTQSASTGYTFKEWNTKADGTGTKLSAEATYTHTVTTSNNVYAVYTQNPDRTIYLEPTGFWNSNNPKYVAHVWGAGEEDITMTGVGEAPYKYYTCDVPAKYTNIVFYRKSTDGSTIWNQTADLTLPNKSTALYTIKSTATPSEGEWKEAYLFYTVTLGSSMFGPYGISYNGQSYYSHKSEDVDVNVPYGASINFIEGQPYSDIYTGDIMEKDVERKFDLTQPYTVLRDVTFESNYVTKDVQVVYLGVPNDPELNWNKQDSYDNFIWRHDSYSGLDMTSRNDRGEYVLEINNVKYYKFNIQPGCNHFCFQRKESKSGDDVSNNNPDKSRTLSYYYEVLTTDVNCYMLDGGMSGEKHTGYWCALPPQSGDYRLLYVEQVVEKDANGNTVVTRKKAHPSDVVKANEITQEGVIVSLHTYKERKYQAIQIYDAGGNHTYYESSNNPEIILQRYDGSKWVDEEWHMVYGPLETLPMMACLPGRKNASPGSDIDDLKYHDGIEIIKNDSHEDQGSGVWNFYIVKNGSTVTLDLNRTHRYTGDYYIRTNAAFGEWNSYKGSDNHMTRSDVSKHHSNYSHYYCKWVEAVGTNVKFTIANDYGMAISDTLVADSTTLWGELLADNDKMVTGETLPASANVRFAWNEKSNFLHRAYLAGSTNVADRFLVLEGKANQLANAEGDALAAGTSGSDRYGLNANEEIFNDISNWVYYADVQMVPRAELKLTAKYNNKVQYFVGTKTAYCDTVLMGTGSDKYLIRLLYDFKTNELISAYVPGGNSTIEPIRTNLMLIRKENNPASQLTFTTNNNKMDEIGKRAYGVLELTQSTLEDNSKNVYVRSLYWISFPFDVRITDIFGFGEYGKHWIIQSYDGAKRAANGLWTDSETNWVYHFDPNTLNAGTHDQGIMKRGVGYVVALDLDQIKADNLFASTRINTLALYFPSTTTITNDIVNTDQVIIDVPAHVCTINRNTPKGDRRIKDSHWNVIGVPSYINAVGNFGSIDGKFDHIEEINKRPEQLQFYYRWEGDYDKYEVVATPPSTVDFNSLTAYMVQYAGDLTWSRVLNEGPAPLAAKRNSDDMKQHHLRLELQQNGQEQDRTFIQLQEDEVTTSFDFNYDLCKIKNGGANIYSLIATDRDPIEVAGNVLPVQETIIPVGVVISAAGEYTFAMPDGTDGIVVEFIDYETNTTTNLLLDNYTITLGKGTFENRFALHVQPSKVTTSVEDINTNSNGVKKYLIDGVLYMQKDGVLYDAQGKLVR